MVLRGFRDDDTRFEPRRWDVLRRPAIEPVLKSGGWLRQALEKHGQHPDPATWQGIPGALVALELLDRADTLPPHPDSQVAQDRELFIARQREAMNHALGVVGVGAETITD